MIGFIKFIGGLFCRHELVFVRNVYGDEIIHLGHKRSVWRCLKCHQHVYKDNLHVSIRIDHYPDDLSTSVFLAPGRDEAIEELMKHGFYREVAQFIVDKALSHPLKTFKEVTPLYKKLTVTNQVSEIRSKK